MANRCARPPSRAAPCAPRRKSDNLDVTASRPFAAPSHPRLLPAGRPASSRSRLSLHHARVFADHGRMLHGKRPPFLVFLTASATLSHNPARTCRFAPLTKADEALPSRPSGYAMRASPEIRQPGCDSIPVLLSRSFVTLTPQRPYTRFTLLIATLAVPCSGIRRSQANVSRETFAFPAAFSPTARRCPVRPIARTLLRRQHPSATEARFSGIRSS